jgi:hypothetical protein
MGYALSRKAVDQVVIVKKVRTTDLGNDGAPFDFSQNRRIDYQQPAELRRDLTETLIQYFQRIGFIN